MAIVNIIDLIRQRSDPSAVAVVQGEQQWTYAQLLSRCAALATTLPRAQRCLRVGLDHASGVEYIAHAMAILAAGCCFVPLPEELSASERQHLIQATALDALLSAEGLRMLPAAQPSFCEGEFSALNPAFVRFSSGTTGRAKGVVLSHQTLLQRIQTANQGLGVGPGDKVLWTLPMAHHFAVSIVLYLYYGATTVIEEQRLGAELLESIQRHSITVMYGSPVHYRQLVAALPQCRLPSLRLAVSTAAALDAKTADAFTVATGQPLLQGLGIIEAGLPLLNLHGGPVTSVGQPLPGVEAKLEGADAQGVGQLYLRGPGVFDAYLHPWHRQQPGTWFATGDLASCDEAGNYSLRGRCVSVINVGGMKVFAEEVETIIQQFPGVQKSLVYGKAHTVYGEVPCALIEATPEVDVKALSKFCRANLAAHKVPVIFQPVDKVPQTASGKVLRTTPPLA